MTLPIDENIILVVLGSLLVLIFFIYIIYKDSVATKKLKDYEFAIEDLNRHIFMLEKKIETDKDTTKIKVADEIQKALTKELKEFAGTFMLSIKELQSAHELGKYDLQNRIARLEERTKEYMSVPSAGILDENRVKALYKAGYSKEDIARELRANVSEVSFILNILSLTDQK